MKTNADNESTIILYSVKDLSTNTKPLVRDNIKSIYRPLSERDLISTVYCIAFSILMECIHSLMYFNAL